MSQHFFTGETPSDKVSLDANFNDLYSLYNLTTQAGSNVSFYGTPTLTQASNWKSFFINSVSINTNGANTLTLTTNIGGTIPSPTYLTATAAASYSLSSGIHGWSNAPSGTIGSAVIFTQVMKIDTSGNLFVGTGTTNPGVEILPAGQVIVGNTGAATGFAFETYSRSGTTIGSITQSGTTGVAYNTSSDYRLKGTVAPIAGSAAFIDALKPCTWLWLSDGTAGTGFIAHELQAVSPGSVTGVKDATRPLGTLIHADGTTVETLVPQPAHLDTGASWTQTGTEPIYQAVEYGSAEVIAMLVAELQAVRRRLHALDGF